MAPSILSLVGAGLFGSVVGWITYRTLRRRSDDVKLGDLAAVVAAVGGGAVVTGRFSQPDLFGAYGIGLAAGFYGYLATAWRSTSAPGFLGGSGSGSAGPEAPVRPDPRDRGDDGPPLFPRRR